MAASATNTSREMGAVFGVAILGSIVNAKLTGDLAARLKAIGIPPNFQSLVLHAVQTGGASSGGAAGSAEHSKNAAGRSHRDEGRQRRLRRLRVGSARGAGPLGSLILAGAVVAFSPSTALPRSRSRSRAIRRGRQTHVRGPRSWASLTVRMPGEGV